MANEKLTVTIEKLVQGGWGLARREGKVLLVRGAIPGETVA
ncbi:MAG: TRAM domain-containing protein, partial [Nitrospiraceae bacterium]